MAQNQNQTSDLDLSSGSGLGLNKKLKIATWNVNSMNVRQDHVLQYLQEDDIDILGVQELKGLRARFPFERLQEMGYDAIINDQPTYNGVAFIYKQSIAPLLNIENTILNNPHFEDVQKRLITLEITGVCTLLCAYIPNGESFTSDKFIYKMNWLAALEKYLKDLQEKLPVVLLGDYNITIDDRDVFDPIGMHEAIHCSSHEREFFKQLDSLNLFDVLRTHQPDAPELFTWWDYRLQSFRRNRGLRIDHIFANRKLQDRITGAYVNKTPRTWERPSDHTPVVFELNI